ncbi:MAG: RNA polymerase sigma factor RpoD/SigA [Acidobacteria bacterium]|nr:MAG: RNA polymerase sigma factor RpoD/SigA [Acidobacteriota bacterium]
MTKGPLILHIGPHLPSGRAGVGTGRARGTGRPGSRRVSRRAGKAVRLGGSLREPGREILASRGRKKKSSADSTVAGAAPAAASAPAAVPQTTPNSDKTILSRYFSEIREYPLLTKEQEQQLARRVQQGDPEAFERLVASNLSFVVKVASEYRNLGLPLEDLLNEGNLGLIEAARRYDPSKGTKFITYAIWWIRKSILKALADQVNLVRVPSYQMKKVKEVRETERALRKELGRTPKRHEIGERLDVSVKKVDQVLQVNTKELSIDDTVSRESTTPVSDYLVDEDADSPETSLLRREGMTLVGKALRYLSEQERIVIMHRFGLDGCPIMTLKEIGEKMGVSRERVRQIETQAKLRLRRMFSRPRGFKAAVRRALKRRGR